MAVEPGPHFEGPQSCISAACHGGAGDKNNQYIRWRKFDFHSRSYATLTTARSARLAENLQIANAAESPRCTICHAPAANISSRLRDRSVILEGVSCENCHGYAESWIRSHTRPDLQHGHRIELGMRELREPYSRANACVACHQNVDPDILSAGHPELIFELDGQAASQPRHWQERHPHAQLWLVGQAAALREMSAQSAALTNDEPRIKLRTEALAWLLENLSKSQRTTPGFPKLTSPATRDAFSEVQAAADNLAKSSSRDWNTNSGLTLLKTLAAVGPEFREKRTPSETHARRAERLVLALDRLTLDLPSKDRTNLNPHLDHLFKLSQNIPEFTASQFAHELDKFQKKLPGP